MKKEKHRKKFIDPIPVSIKTHTSDVPERRLDYILINTNMFKEYEKKSAKIPQVFNPNKMREISDHLPVTATFKIK